ncbi:hypothetical protein ABFS83_01G109600 [Erythranthe nasuta]
MDRQPHDYGAPMTYGQQQQQATNMQQQQYGFHSQHQQFPPSVHGPPFLPSHPSLQQQFLYPRPMQQSQIYPHLHPHLHQQSPSSFPPHLYAVKNGPEFEAVVREREQDNPAYSFLFGGEGHNYYRHKLWIATRPYNPPFPLHPPNNPINAPNVASPYRPPFMGVSRPLPADIEMELNGVLKSLTGTKESIKGAKTWFMQRSPFLPGLAEALRDRVFSLDDSERQLHIVYLANDILFDSLQRRVNPQEMDNEALAFKPVLASMLARIYHNPHNKDENQSRIQKILQFWSIKKVFDHETMFGFENDMMNGLPPTPFPGPHADQSSFSGDRSAAPGMHQMANYNSLQWQQHDKHNPISKLPDQEYSDKQIPPLPPQQFHPASIPSMHLPLLPVPSRTGEKLPPYPLFPPGLIPSMVRKMQIGSGVPYSPMSPLDIPTVIPPSNVSPSEVLASVQILQGDWRASIPSMHLPLPPVPSQTGEKLPPYPLFPPGIIPGMVRKMLIGSGVPYSPMSPLDIPTVIPPSNVSPSEVLERVSKFFKEIGEVNPSVGPTESRDDNDEYDYDYERDFSARKGGACIPPPPVLNVDSDSRTRADGSVERKSGSGRLGLGSSSDPNGPSEYDDV